VESLKLIEEYYAESFDTWVKRLAGRCPSIMDAEDVVQESFLRAMQYCNSFNPELSKLETWFSNIVNNTHRDMKRKEFNSVEVKEDDWFTKEADEYEDDEFTCSKISERIASVKRQVHKNILYTHFIVGCKVGEVSRQLDIPVETVKTVIKRFKKEVALAYGRES